MLPDRSEVDDDPIGAALLLAELDRCPRHRAARYWRLFWDGINRTSEADPVVAQAAKVLIEAHVTIGTQLFAHPELVEFRAAHRAFLVESGGLVLAAEEVIRGE